MGAAALARAAHKAAERRDARALRLIQAEIARRPLPEQELCRREWLRQAQAQAQRHRRRSSREAWV